VVMAECFQSDATKQSTATIAERISGCQEDIKASCYGEAHSAAGKQSFRQVVPIEGFQAVVQVYARLWKEMRSEARQRALCANRQLVLPVEGEDYTVTGWEMTAHIQSMSSRCGTEA
jgi:hypothetical protein